MLHSILDLYNIGLGPSASHTTGPMLAAYDVCLALHNRPNQDMARLRVTLFGSLAWTGEGHGTNKAVIAGLHGEHPRNTSPDIVNLIIKKSIKRKTLSFDHHDIAFDPKCDMMFDTQTPQAHPNTLLFECLNKEGQSIQSFMYASVGGGSIHALSASDSMTQHQMLLNSEKTSSQIDPTYPFHNAETLFDLAKQHHCSIGHIGLKNTMKATQKSQEAIFNELDIIADIMLTSIEQGLLTEGLLPGPLKVPRRAKAMLQKAKEIKPTEVDESYMKLKIYAIAVNEHNAAGGRIVAAPTNGASGLIPSILKHLHDTHPDFDIDMQRSFLLTAAMIGLLYKQGASLSAAEVGCQGEVGVACSMAAGAYCEIKGGSLEQIANAAEIAMEHHLGLTCDPVGGQVQIPCIERNAIGAMKAIHASELALLGDGSHQVSLDQVIATMYETGMNMSSIYKETALGGLAKALGASARNPEC